MYHVFLTSVDISKFVPCLHCEVFVSGALSSNISKIYEMENAQTNFRPMIAFGFLLFRVRCKNYVRMMQITTCHFNVYSNSLDVILLLQRLSDALDAAQESDVVGIDEGQFFTGIQYLGMVWVGEREK
jgi:hypothetical protein